MKPSEKKCPRCAEIIKAEAQICRHCGYEFSNEEMLQAKNAAMGRKIAGCLVPLGLVFLLGYCVNQAGKLAPSAIITSPSETTGTNGPATKTSYQSNWDYSEDKDGMRGTVTRHAQTTSDNEVELPFPYNGGVRAHIDVRHRATDGLAVMFLVDKGQILCRSYGSSVLHVKFDDGPVKAYECTDSASGGSDVVFIEATTAFLTKLKRSRKVMIEAPMYERGPEQWTFSTAGLVWK